LEACSAAASNDRFFCRLSQRVTFTDIVKRGWIFKWLVRYKKDITTKKARTRRH
jgi:hypothetical protein